MRVSSQHTESWISPALRDSSSRAPPPGARERGREEASVCGKKESERKGVKARKEKTGAKAATQKRRGMECKMVHVHPIHQPFSVLHRVSPPPRLLFRPVLLVAPSRFQEGCDGGGGSSHASIAGWKVLRYRCGRLNREGWVHFPSVTHPTTLLPLPPPPPPPPSSDFSPYPISASLFLFSSAMHTRRHALAHVLFTSSRSLWHTWVR